jgi:hypothetical protein
MSFTVGEEVRLMTPDNPRLDNQPARIVELTEWGAHVACRAAGSGKFRALYSEMASSPNSAKRAHDRSTAAVDSGYTGDVCMTCGGFRMKRVGTCLTCDDCGTSSGCG